MMDSGSERVGVDGDTAAGMADVRGRNSNDCRTKKRMTIWVGESMMLWYDA